MPPQSKRSARLDVPAQLSLPWRECGEPPADGMVLPSLPGGPPPPPIFVRNGRARRYILRVLKTVGGNKTTAAKVLGFDRRTLYRKLERYGVADAAE